MSGAKVKMREKKMRNQPVSVQYPSSPVSVESSTQNGRDTSATGNSPCLPSVSVTVSVLLLGCCICLSLYYSFWLWHRLHLLLLHSHQMSLCIMSVTPVYHWPCISLWFIFACYVSEIIKRSNCKWWWCSVWHLSIYRETEDSSSPGWMGTWTPEGWRRLC